MFHQNEEGGVICDIYLQIKLKSFRTCKYKTLKKHFILLSDNTLEGPPGLLFSKHTYTHTQTYTHTHILTMFIIRLEKNFSGGYYFELCLWFSFIIIICFFFCLLFLSSLHSQRYIKVVTLGVPMGRLWSLNWL